MRMRHFSHFAVRAHICIIIIIRNDANKVNPRHLEPIERLRKLLKGIVFYLALIIYCFIMLTR